MNYETDRFITVVGKRPECELFNMPVKENAELPSLELLNETIVGIREIPGTEKFYNAAAWEVDKKTFLLGRQVKVAGGEGEPDVGSLVLLALGIDGNIVSSKEVWQPKDGEHFLEDARAIRLPSGKVIIGFTSVKHVGNDYIPHPAVLITSTEELVEGMFSKPKIIKAMSRTALRIASAWEDGYYIPVITSAKEPMEGTLLEPEVIEIIGRGDQTTPLGEDIDILTGKNVTAIGLNLFMFRPEGEKNGHRLQVFGYQQENSEVTHKQYIDFPKDIPWAEWRVGTTMPPIWLNENEAVFPIHGIKLVDGKYVYSIGTSRLLRDENGTLSVDNISQESIIDPDLFVGMFSDDEVELHEERRVVYCCGGVPIHDDSGKLENLKLYVNVGDKRTVEVTVAMAKLIEDWQRDEAIEQEMIVAA
jgi:hypothetical protein